VGARENRAFLQRAVWFLAGEAGIRQFLDIGTGLPTQGNVHEIAQAVAPEARVVYVDNDPVVHAHANALLSGDNTASLLGDLRDPDEILADPETHRLIDFGQPVGILLVAVLHFIRDEEDPGGILPRLKAAMAPGSYLVLSHAIGDLYPREVGAEAPRPTTERPLRWCFAPARRSSAFSTGWSSSSRGWYNSRNGVPTATSPAAGASSAPSPGSQPSLARTQTHGPTAADRNETTSKPTLSAVCPLVRFGVV
jgi:hypothetical protein